MDRVSLPNVTIVSIACNKYGDTISALNKCLDRVIPKRTVLFSDMRIINGRFETIKIGKLDWDGYNWFVLKELYKYIDTDYAMIVQWDGYILNANLWTDDFLKYDYIGAQWLYQDGRSVGNGGFSLRSKKLMDAIANDPIVEITSPEDECIGRLYRKHLEKNHDIKFAPPELCDRFSFELRLPYQKTFGFHGFHHNEFKDHIVIRRTSALGDVIMAEPLMEHYNNRGFQVVLDTNVSYMPVFMQHRYEVKHILQMDGSIRPAAYIDLDMTYEHTPKQLVLKSYYEAAGVEDGELKNAQLDFPINHLNKVFKKYAVIHIDKTHIPHREVNGIEWKKVTEFLKHKGYDVFQVGKGVHEVVGIEYNTNTLGSLMYVLAGADIFIGNDSGVGQMAIALKRPSIIFYGSVNPKFRHTNFENIYPIHTACPSKELEYCYHNSVDSVIGTYCVFDEGNPPCTRFETNDVIAAIDEISKK